MSARSCVLFAVVAAAAAPLAGCARKFPPVVPVEGRVLVGGKPLPKAAVTFVPILDHFGAEAYSAGVTDEEGKFTLTCRYNNQPGAAVGEHVVLVTEDVFPDKLRRAQDGRVLDAYRAKLGNRPIPPQYTSFGRSPLRVEIQDGQGPVTVELTRP